MTSEKSFIHSLPIYKVMRLFFMGLILVVSSFALSESKPEGLIDEKSFFSKMKQLEDLSALNNLSNDELKVVMDLRNNDSNTATIEEDNLEPLVDDNE